MDARSHGVGQEDEKRELPREWVLEHGSKTALLPNWSSPSFTLLP
jgi:hypothetical protein